MIILTIISSLLSIALKSLWLVLKLSYKAGVGVVKTTAVAATKAAKKTSEVAHKKWGKNSKTYQRMARSVQFISKGARLGVAALIKLLEFLIVVIDAIVTILFMGWVGVIILLVIFIAAAGGAWFILKDNPEAFDINLDGGSTSVTTDGGGDQNYDFSNIKDLPPVATHGNIGEAMIANAVWAMANKEKAGPDCFKYQQGDTDKCNYDCSTWSISLLEMAGWYFDGDTLKKKDERYLITRDRKSDLQGYMFTGLFLSTVNSGEVRPSSLDDLRPGDIMVNAGHMQVYAGKHNGKHIISNASTPGAVTYRDLALTERASDVGFQEISSLQDYRFFRPDDIKHEN